jgi:hypothetical protein
MELNRRRLKMIRCLVNFHSLLRTKKVDLAALTQAQAMNLLLNLTAVRKQTSKLKALSFKILSDCLTTALKERNQKI